MPEVSSDNSTEDVQSGSGSQSVFQNLLQRFDEAGASLRERLGRNKATMQVENRFAVLRTRVLREMRAHGWVSLGVIPVTEAAGATYIAANLALAAARRPRGKVLLVDLALSRPAMADQLGIPHGSALGEMLTGGKLPKDPFQSVPDEPNLHVLTIDRMLPDGAELLQDDETRAAIRSMVETMQPDLAVFDLSPVIGTDEGLAALPMMDAVLLIADGRDGTARDMADCQRLLVDMPPLMGVVLNKAELLR